MKKVLLDLRESLIVNSIPMSMHVEGGVNQVIIRDAGLPSGTYGVALLLACAGFQRFVHELFLVAAKEVLTLSAEDVEKFKKTDVFTAGNPNPHNIKRMFSTIGIFNLFSSPHGATSLSALEAPLGDYIKERNKITHGASWTNFDGEPFSQWAKEYSPPPKERTKEGIDELRAFFEDFAPKLYQLVLDRVNEKIARRVSP